eukprot:scaffold2800_cov393-Prasinococcus_capsulatus_cf.AAC.1
MNLILSACAVHAHLPCCPWGTGCALDSREHALSLPVDAGVSLRQGGLRGPAHLNMNTVARLAPVPPAPRPVPSPAPLGPPNRGPGRGRASRGLPRLAPPFAAAHCGSREKSCGSLRRKSALPLRAHTHLPCCPGGTGCALDSREYAPSLPVDAGVSLRQGGLRGPAHLNMNTVARLAPVPPAPRPVPSPAPLGPPNR